MSFDSFLAERGLRLEAIVIGGAALNLLGIASRPTRDCDILHPELPAAILEAARLFAVETRGTGEVLRDDWLNNGPASLTDVLPAGWLDAHPDWPAHVRATLEELARRLGHGV
jgi:hypothetical protein